MAYGLDIGGAGPPSFAGKREMASPPDPARSIVGPWISGVLQPQMLVCKNADNAIRWQAGERLNHLFEERCDQLHSRATAPRWR